MKRYDYLIVGAGLSGSICAERLASQKNKKILVIDKRDHIGGNCYDYFDETDILVHKYGPHIFHTNSEDVWNYLSQFTKWNDYEHRVLASIENKLYPIPINITTVNKLYGLNLDETNIQEFYDAHRKKDIKIKNSKDVIISKVGKDLYNLFFKYYTKKQWDLWPSDLSPSVCERIPARTNYDDRYFTDKYQGTPIKGYTDMIKKILNHENIEVRLSTNYFDIKKKVDYDYMIYTGRIDEFFDYKFGILPYISLIFEFQSVQKEFFQPVAQVNYTSSLTPAYTRIIEFKHMTKQVSDHTTISKEYRSSEGEPFYPVPRKQNHEVYNKYKDLADEEKNVFFLGRLAQYKYYNMDVVCLNSLSLFSELCNL